MKSGRPSAQPVCEKCTWASTIPGVIQSPLRSRTSIPFGGGHSVRGPAQSIAPPRTITTQAGAGAAPVPSNNLAPISAPGGGGGSRGGGRAGGDADFSAGLRLVVKEAQ